MFDFGVKKSNTVSTKSIMLDKVDDKYYIKKEDLDRFEEDYSVDDTADLGRVGYILPKVITGTSEVFKGKHQSNRVYRSEKGCPTLMASRIGTVMMTCEPREDLGAITVRGKRISIRNLTPQEYWRIQGIDDERFFRSEKVIPEERLYERAGRAICIPMLEDIFKKFFKGEDFDKLRILEAFSGIGSQRIALDNAKIPYESVGIFEVDRYGLLAYDAIHNYVDPKDYSEGKTDEEMLKEMRDINIAYNFSTYKDEMPTDHENVVKLYNATKRSHNYGDISKVDPNNLPDFNFFTYSFPCKNISISGTHKGFEKGSETQSSLVWECEKVIRTKKPKYLMLENVKNIISDENMVNFQEWIDLLKSYGYKSHWEVYNSNRYGVPQNRERVIMMSKLVD